MATSPISTIETSALAESISAEPVFTEAAVAGGMADAGWRSDRSNFTKGSSAAAAKLTLVAPRKARTREQVLLETLPVVRYVAHRIYARLPQHVELEDLVSAGVVGLIDAYKKFDVGKDVLFRTYASVRIRGAILDSLRGLDWAPRELRRKARTMEETKQRLTQALGRSPEANEVAERMGITLAAYRDLQITVKGLEIGSLQEARSVDSAQDEIGRLESDPEDDPLHRAMRSERAAHLSAAVAKLPEREQRVLQMYYVEEMTLREISLVLGVVESRVSQIRTVAIQRLRDFFAAHPALQQA
jgi:RNA polymerase sigma factor FliA